jgi:hypothetical protein
MVDVLFQDWVVIKDFCQFFVSRGCFVQDDGVELSTEGEVSNGKTVSNNVMVV